MESIISALIAGGLALIGVVITNMSSNNKIEQRLFTAQAVTDTKIENLTEEVRKHNNFASRVPIVEEQIKTLNKEMDEVNHRIEHLEHNK